MQITIDQDEIERAIQAHVQSMLTIKEGQDMAISLKAGRGESGFTATIEIGAKSDTAPFPLSDKTLGAVVATGADTTVKTVVTPAAPVERVNGKQVTPAAVAPTEDATPSADVPAKAPGNTLFGGLKSNRSPDDAVPGQVAAE